jgi:type II secretory pathway pseudopilin PulG
MRNVKKENKHRHTSQQRGFSYIDVMISITIFMVGILAMSGALLANRMRSQIIENQLIAKQLILSSLESVLAAKELKPNEEVTGWDTVGNIGSNPIQDINRGVFETGFRPVRQSPGEDGIIGTADDACVGTGGCGTNNSPVINGFERKIEITDISSVDYTTIRQRNVKIIIRYQANGRVLEESIKTIITDYK